jgi:hypothetical protein
MTDLQMMERGVEFGLKPQQEKKQAKKMKCFTNLDKLLSFPDL